MDKVNEFMKKYYVAYMAQGVEYILPIKRVKCLDGFSISVQANKYAYCSPRCNKGWPYSEVELGFPSELDPLISEYAEDPDDVKTIYGYVPINIVCQLIDKHGGISNFE